MDAVEVLGGEEAAAGSRPLDVAIEPDHLFAGVPPHAQDALDAGEEQGRVGRVLGRGYDLHLRHGILRVDASLADTLGGAAGDLPLVQVAAPPATAGERVVVIADLILRDSSDQHLLVELLLASVRVLARSQGRDLAHEGNNCAIVEDDYSPPVLPTRHAAPFPDAPGTYGLAIVRLVLEKGLDGARVGHRNLIHCHRAILAAREHPTDISFSSDTLDDIHALGVAHSDASDLRQ
mmetsp:Transcript_26256/g.52351  ORF Transcript_26256/g.52351 Transcript_26256/m.52351 type:complete len:235 (-) Transcript_26256:14-718(-)